ncbi:MAG: hypothetical protein HUJ26_23665, partial [Planctomycetaceae bacterium]|nr:hypothetical protein [Planctomycetaceae bacterium]
NQHVRFFGNLRTLELEEPNFCPNPNEPYESDPVFAFEHLLSIERVVRRLVCLAKSRDMGVAKTTAYEVCDILSSLKNRFKNGPPSQEAELFKEFWNPKLGAEMISESLKGIPGVGDSLAKMSNDCYDELRKVVIESVWYKQKVTNTGVLVKKKNLIDEVEESQDVFVANVMRALRNGHHGYFTEGEKQKRPSRYLSLVTGETPDSMIQLPMLWFLAYLADPKILDWEPLQIGGYEL